MGAGLLGDGLGFAGVRVTAGDGAETDGAGDSGVGVSAAEDNDGDGDAVGTGRMASDLCERRAIDPTTRTDPVSANATTATRNGLRASARRNANSGLTSTPMDDNGLCAFDCTGANGEPRPLSSVAHHVRNTVAPGYLTSWARADARCGYSFRMWFADLVRAAAEVAATSSRNAKIDRLAGVLRAAAPDEIEAAVGFLIGWPRQGRIGVGWATAYGLDVRPAAQASLTVLDADDAIDRIHRITGPGSQQERGTILAALLSRATAGEQDFIRRVFTGELRHGALEGVVSSAVARAAGVPATVLRRAMMLSGDLGTTARIALTEGRVGLERIGLTLLRPVLPMLASTADTVEEALAFSGPASVEWKLDGIRIQAHRDADAVRVFSRNGNDLTDRVPDVVGVVQSLLVRSVVLDGEAIGLDESRRPYAFQETMSGTGRRTDAFAAVPFFFDVLHLNGKDLLDHPLTERAEVLARITGDRRVPSTVTDDPAVAAAFLAGALEAGHEGVMIKDISSTYQAGRRGKSWRKVKPVKTFDLVVLAAEWGHGRRHGWLSNLHLGALDAAGNPVMVGKTFKGMTDALLAWQTDKLQSIKVRDEGITVWVRPQLVVEIELEGVQTSTRYPGGIALRFARLLRYRPDKSAADADTLASLRALRNR